MGQRSQIVSPLFCRYRTTMHWSVPGSSWCLVTIVQAAMWLLIRTWKRVKLRGLHCKCWWEGEERMKDKEGWLKERRRRERKGGERKEKGGREGGAKSRGEKRKGNKRSAFLSFPGKCVSSIRVIFSLWWTQWPCWMSRTPSGDSWRSSGMSVYIWVGKI